eukprot:751838-Hanusia_phi.AAC.1
MEVYLKERCGSKEGWNMGVIEGGGTFEAQSKEKDLVNWVIGGMSNRRGTGWLREAGMLPLRAM